jgi:hypothetical protein
MSDFRNSGMVRLGSFTLPAAATFADGQIGNVAAVGGTPVVISNGGGEDSGTRWRSLQLWAATNADNAVGTIGLYLAPKAHKSSVRYLDRIGQVVVTGGTKTINDVVSGTTRTFQTGEFIADTMVWTVDANGLLAKLSTALTAPDVQVHSPVANLVAQIILPDIGNNDIVVDPFVGGGSATSIAICYRWTV